MVARLLATIDQLRSEYAALELRHAVPDWEARGEYASPARQLPQREPRLCFLSWGSRSAQRRDGGQHYGTR